MAAALALLGAEARAGAWTQEQGAAFVSIGGGVYEADDGGGEWTGATYGEYGLRDWLTVGAALETTVPRDAQDDGQTTLYGFARARLWTGPQGEPVSIQLGWVEPLGALVDTGAPQFNREQEADIRLAAGKGFASRWGPGWLNAETALRLRLEDSADEIRVDLTAGLRPHPDWLVMVQSFNTLGLRNNEPFGGDYDVFRVAPAIGYQITPTTTVVLGVEREVAGRNIDFGARVRLSLWRSF
jgi:hypothetical protein